jgi:hypothetical protein
LIEASKQRLKCTLLKSAHFLEFGEKLHQGLGSMKMGPYSLVNRIPKNFQYFNHGVHVKAVEPESISIGRLVQVATIDAVPDGDIGG